MNRMLSNCRKVFMALLSICLFSMSIQSVGYANEETTIKIPDTAAGIWTDIDEHTTAIDKLIASNQLTTIHAHAFAIRDLINALPEKSQDLSADQLAIVKRDTSYVDQLAIRLDKTGDANDKDGTAISFNKLKKILGQIRANYKLTSTLNNK